MQMPIGEVPEGSGADAEVRFRKVPVQRLGQVLEGSGADTEVRFRRFRCRRWVRFRRVPVQIPR